MPRASTIGLGKLSHGQVNLEVGTALIEFDGSAGRFRLDRAAHARLFIWQALPMENVGHVHRHRAGSHLGLLGASMFISANIELPTVGG